MQTTLRSYKKLLAAAFCLLAAGIVRAQLTFTPLSTPTARNLAAISFDPGGSTGYACGDTGTVIKTSDGGTNWTMLNTGVTARLWDIRVIPGSGGQKVIAVGDDNTVIKSLDGGSSWSVQSIPFQSGSFVFGIHCADSLNYLACGGDYASFSGAILKTSNGGASWTKTAVNGSIFLDKITQAGSSTVYTVGTNMSFSDGSVQKSTNGGAGWSTVKTSTDIITNVWAITEDTVVAVGLAGQIWRTTDGGANWTDLSTGSVDFYGIRFFDSNNGIVCGGPSGTVLRTTNGGLSWSPVTYSFSGSLQSVAMTSSAIYVAGDNGHVAKAAFSTGIKQVTWDNQVRIWPNPANSIINLTLPASPVSVELYSMDGRRLFSQVFCNGEGAIGTAELPAGLYTLKCSTGGETVVRKISVLH